MREHLGCLTNPNYENIDDTYYDLLNEREDISSINPIMNQKNISKGMIIILFDWMWDMCEELFSVPVYFLSVDLVKLHLRDHPDVKRNKLQLVGVICMMSALKMDKPSLFDDDIFSLMSEMTSSVYSRDEVKKSFIDYKYEISTGYDYLHFYNEILWANQKISNIDSIYSEMINYLRSAWHICDSSSRDIAYSCFLEVLQNNNITYTGRKYGKVIHLLNERSTTYQRGFMLPPRYAGSEMTQYVMPQDVMKMLTEGNLPLSHNIMGSSTEYVILGSGLHGAVFYLKSDPSVAIKGCKMTYHIDIKMKDDMMITQSECINEMIMISQMMTHPHVNFLKYEKFLICPNYDEPTTRYSIYIMMERLDVTFDNLFNKPITYDFILSILYQILMTIKTLQDMFQGVHNDLHSGNIMFKKINTDSPYIGDSKIPNHGYVFKLFDFGLMSTFKKKIISRDIINNLYNKYNISSEYMPGYDIGCILYIFIIRMKYYLPKDKEERLKIKSIFLLLVGSISDRIISLSDFLKTYYNNEERPNHKLASLPLVQLIDNEIFDAYRTKD